MEFELKIEDGVSAWRRPSSLLWKKTPGTYKIVVDYRALNYVTVTDASPAEDLSHPPGAGEALHVVMRDGCHQVPLQK